MDAGLGVEVANDGCASRVVRGAGQQVVKRGQPVQPGIAAVQVGVKIKVRQVREKEAEVGKQRCSVIGWARQEERAGPWPSPPQHLSLQQGR